MEFLIKAAQLLMSLSILVILHELGHFIPAKLFKTRVEKFYLFFDPWFSVVKKKIGGTEYGIGWLPLGGYVKISGMIDESMDKEQMKKDPEPWEFRSKPAWQRLIIMLGGVVVNLFLGIFIYSMTLYVYGDKYLPNENIKDGIWCVDKLAKTIGFQNGDKIISADGVKVERYEEILEKIIVSNTITVERDGVIIPITIPTDIIAQFLENDNRQLVYVRIPTIVGEVTAANAKKGGLKEKDLIKAINGIDYTYFDEFKVGLSNYSDKYVDLTIMRNEEERNLKILVSNEGLLGFDAYISDYDELETLNIYSFSSIKYGFFASFPAGYNKAIKKLGSYITQFKKILSPSTGAYKGVGGFKGIGSLFPDQDNFNWKDFWNLTALLSLMLAFMNILPIPALDGGHVLFLIYEMIIGKPAPEKFMQYATMVGIFLLLGLMVYANGNDFDLWEKISSIF